VIGRFPWDPFPAGAPPPTGDDPLLATIYRGAIEGGDAYRAVRAAVRREGGVLRVGNRFVPDGRYREIAFVALGHAASSMALAALHVFGDRLTQGFVAGPEAPPDVLPFRSTTVDDGWGADEAAAEVVAATREIAAGLRASDLLLLLVSPGALRALLLPPAGLPEPDFAGLLRELHAQGVRGVDVEEVARVLGTGGVGGRLLPAGGTAADVQVLLVDRGDGPVTVGGGPTFPVTDRERGQARATLAYAGALDRLPSSARAGLQAAGPTPGPPERRPVVIASPADALRASGDAAFDKGWTARVGVLGLNERPEAAADRFVSTVEEVLTSSRPGREARSKGLVVLATSTLDVPEGVPEGPACEAFLKRARAGLRRREMSLGVFRTGGPLGPGSEFAGGAVGAPGDRDATGSGDAVRPIRVPRGITDVGLVIAAVLPASPDGSRRRPR
jgi:glycerate-2-kinase